MPVTKDDPKKRTPAQQFVVDVENSTELNDTQKNCFTSLAAIVDPGATKAGYSRDSGGNLERDEHGEYIRQWGTKTEPGPNPPTNTSAGGKA